MHDERGILPAGMIPVEEARARILAHFAPLPAEPTPLLEAVGQVLAADVVATFNIPPLANTSMDGYAVRAADTAGATPATPRTLRVTGWLPAGTVYAGSIGAGEAVRIMTGAPMPDGADAVVPFEETDEQERPSLHDRTTEHAGGSQGGGLPGAGPGDTPSFRAQAPSDTVRIDVAAGARANVREVGEDVRTGEVVLHAGTVLGVAQIGVLGSLGLDRVSVYRRPRVAILSTGDELLRPGEPLTPGKIYDANAFSLAAAVREAGGIPRVLEVARDTVEALTARIHEALADADLLITSAGVSRGDFDVVKDVLAREGEIGFWTVNMRPGKPLAFGRFTAAGGRPVPHLGLPGNPVSALMTFELFGRAAIATMLGNPDGWQRPVVRARAIDRIVSGDGRRFYARAIVSVEAGAYVARLTGPQGSGVLTSMALANGYAICPEGVPAIEVGEQCDVILLDEGLAAYSSRREA
jgi:molybdopterin molybdotransferase